MLTEAWKDTEWDKLLLEFEERLLQVSRLKRPGQQRRLEACYRAALTRLGRARRLDRELAR